MKRNENLLNRLDKIYGELKKAERQIKHQYKEMKRESKMVLSKEMIRAKKSIENLYRCYEFIVNRYENKSGNSSRSVSADEN